MTPPHNNPQGTAGSEQQKEHCEHECICMRYANTNAYGYPCTRNTGLMGTVVTAPCEHDTRPNTIASAPGPDVDCHSCKFGERCRPISYVPPCYNHGQDSPASAAKAAREEALSLLEEWDYHNNRNFGKPHPILFDMIRLVRDNPEEVRKHLESLRGRKE